MLTTESESVPPVTGTASVSTANEGSALTAVNAFFPAKITKVKDRDGDADFQFARLEKTLRRLTAISQEDPAVALQLEAYLSRAWAIAATSLAAWSYSYGDSICEVVGAECGDRKSVV